MRLDIASDGRLLYLAADGAGGGRQEESAAARRRPPPSTRPAREPRGRG